MQRLGTARFPHTNGSTRTRTFPRFPPPTSAPFCCSLWKIILPPRFPSCSTALRPGQEEVPQGKAPEACTSNQHSACSETQPQNPNQVTWGKTQKPSALPGEHTAVPFRAHLDPRNNVFLERQPTASHRQKASCLRLSISSGCQGVPALV